MVLLSLTISATAQAHTDRYDEQNGIRIQENTLQSGAVRLALPDRLPDAPTGSMLEAQLRTRSLTDREQAIFAAITSGNIPDFLRNLVEITTTRTIGGNSVTLSYWVIPDYMAIGSDDDFFRIPMTPILAQRLCQELRCTLPTRRMVDQIWQSAPLKLNPQPIPPSDQMTTIPVMFTHHQMVQEQRDTHQGVHPAGTLVAGHKKDVILSNRIYSQPAPRRVVIYGWHYTSGTPIQPVYSGHAETYADYSHGIRAVRDTMLLNGEPVSARDILRHPEWHVLLSDEGVLPLPFYPLANTLSVPDAWGVRQEGAGALRLLVSEVPAVTAYRVHLSADGIVFPQTQTHTRTLTPDNLIIDALPSDVPVYIRLQAISDHEGPFSEVLAGIPSVDRPSVLVVNGFDRPITGNTRDFVRQYIPGIRADSRTFDTATNEAVTQGLVSLADYTVVMWILGAESTANETFSSQEQALVRGYLDAGGALFVSGSEIAWDLDQRGSEADRTFFREYLKSAYVADAPNNQRDTWYRVEGLSNGPFAGLTDIRFDNGSQGTWNVSWPDVLAPVHGGQLHFGYTGVSGSNGAGVGFRGVFPGSATRQTTARTPPDVVLNPIADAQEGSSGEGSVLVLGFPFETVYPAAARDQLLGYVLDFLLDPVSSSIDTDSQHQPRELVLEQNYPNPFNGQTRFRYYLPEADHVELVIYATTGQRIHALVEGFQSAGSHEVSWNARGLASGVYISALSAGGITLHRSVLLLK